MHEVLVNRLGGLSLPRKSVARLTDHLDMTLDVYRGHKTTIQEKYSSDSVNVQVLKFLADHFFFQCPRYAAARNRFLTYDINRYNTHDFFIGIKVKQTVKTRPCL